MMKFLKWLGGLVTNPATGFSRTITVGGDGSYRVSQLPTGQYQISRNGGAPRAAMMGR